MAGTIIGSNFASHDSSACWIDMGKKEIFAIDTERYSRVKHDDYLALQPVAEAFALTAKEQPMVIGFDFSTQLKEEYGYFKYLGGIRRDSELTEAHRKMKKRAPGQGGIMGKLSALSQISSDSGNLRYAMHRVLWNFQYEFLQKQRNISWPKSLADAQDKIGKLYSGRIREETGAESEFMFFDHHLCHALPAHYFSGFGDSLILSIDAYGDGSSTKIFRGAANEVTEVSATPRKYSIGSLYTLFTWALDLIPLSDEGKVEALANYGTTKDNELYQILCENVAFDKGTLQISFLPGIKEAIGMEDFSAQDLGKAEVLRQWRTKMSDADVAAAIQFWAEEFVLGYAKAALAKYGSRNIVLTGGLFANVKVNLRIFEESGAQGMYVLPAMGDSGTCLGAAIQLIRTRKPSEDLSWLSKKVMPYWGTSYTRQEAKAVLEKWKGKITYEDLGEKWPEEVARLLCENKIVSIFHGRMEFGPRALGNRSILGDPTRMDLREILNSIVKRRKYYQPFCPSILESERTRLFERSYPNKHMTCAFRLKKEFCRELPAIIHVDGTARPQFVEEADNPKFFRLLTEMKRRNGYGAVLNTSFNLHGRTMVRTPHDALVDYLDSGMDYVCIEGYLARRERFGAKP